MCFIVVIEIEIGITKFSKCLVFLQSVTLHTNLGDIKCEIFCDEVPRTAEVLNFLLKSLDFYDINFVVSKLKLNSCLSLFSLRRVSKNLAIVDLEFD